ncbi:MAG TPA: hypothetical protein VMV05_12265 [bacterium]|nr:hypothetical protein [bacterium]
MNFQQFEEWMGKLAKEDREFLEQNHLWKKEYQQVRKNRSMPEGFVTKTMEILEGGSESET